MQGNGTKVAFIIGFILISGYYLQFSFRYWLETRHLESLDETAKKEYLQENRAKINALEENIINLGLDLQGGMHVTLELETINLIRGLAADRVDSSLNNSLRAAREQSLQQDLDFIDLFVVDFEQNDPNARLSRYFRNESDYITRRSSNEEIRVWLKAQRDAAVSRAMEIVRTRVDRYGVNEPTIVRQGQNRIVTELAGITDEERVRNLLKGTAQLEFRLTADPNDLLSSLEQIIRKFDIEEADSDTTTVKRNPLLEVMIPQGRSVIFASTAGEDTAAVNSMLQTSEISTLLPRNTVLIWTAKPAFSGEDGRKYFNLIGVKSQVELTGDVIEEARPSFDPVTNEPLVTMKMNSEGARKWARITGANIGKPVAIILDDYVYTYPNVINKINDGNSSITGLSGVSEAEDLVNILLSGALPAPLEIVEERTVGPTLGEASIKAGFNSLLTGLFLVAVFMIVYYQKSGVIADLALTLNIFFIFGVLAAFKATLTLPGLAGIVLTIGMAVDANVLIFDRIREEMRSGKSLLAAIDSGYSNAMSAIIDSNITTFLTGAILYSFGVGPIKGFAVTLMAGIACSLFSAIVITRVVIDYLTREKSAQLSIG